MVFSQNCRIAVAVRVKKKCRAAIVVAVRVKKKCRAAVVVAVVFEIAGNFRTVANLRQMQQKVTVMHFEHFTINHKGPFSI